MDPNLEIRGEGQGVSSRPWDKGGGGWLGLKNFFWPSGPQSVWSKNKGGGWPPGPLLWIRYCSCVYIINYWDQLCGLQPNFVPSQLYCSCFCLAKQWAVVVVISHVEHKVLVVVTVIVFQLLHSFAHMGNKWNILYHLPYSSHYSTQKKKYRRIIFINVSIRYKSVGRKFVIIFGVTSL